jgi:hypothetical protein
MAQPMDFESAAKIAGLYFLMADQIADTARRPTCQEPAPSQPRARRMSAA